MCGIFGAISGYLNRDEVDTFRTLGAISFPRGDDSTGIMFARKRDGTHNDLAYGFDKAVSDPWGYLFSPGMNQYLSERGNMRALIGHCRSATVGSVNRENAHPFRFNHIIGVHNGTIHSISKERAEGTDSEEIFRRIAAHGAKETLKQIKGGAYALVWFDMEENTLNIIRNDQRSLFMMRTSSGGTYYIASERIFLDYIEARSQTVFDDPVQFDVGSLYQFNLEKIGAPKVTKDFTSDEPLAPFSRRQVGFHGPAWESDEDGGEEVEKKEQKQEETKALTIFEKPNNYNSRSIILSSLSFIDEQPWTVTDKSTLLRCQDLKVIEADNVLPSALAKLPYRIMINGAARFLRYQTYNNTLLTPVQLVRELEKGSCWSRTVAHPRSNIYWIGASDYLLEDEAFEPTFRQHLISENNPPVKGKFVYLTAEELQKDIKNRHVN